MRIRILNLHWIISFFLTANILVLRAEDFSLAFLVDILPLGSGSVDPHNFLDSDPGSRNVLDPKDPDPKPWLTTNLSYIVVRVRSEL